MHMGIDSLEGGLCTKWQHEAASRTIASFMMATSGSALLAAAARETACGFGLIPEATEEISSVRGWNFVFSQCPRA